MLPSWTEVMIISVLWFLLMYINFLVSDIFQLTYLHNFTIFCQRCDCWSVTGTSGVLWGMILENNFLIISSPFSSTESLALRLQGRFPRVKAPAFRRCPSTWPKHSFVKDLNYALRRSERKDTSSSFRRSRKKSREKPVSWCFIIQL